MDLSASILGRNIVTYLSERQHAPILKIGRDTFDRASLAGVACFNFTAAANLSRVLNTEIRVKDTRDVFDHVDPVRFVLPRLGSVSLAVLGAAFEVKGLGGATPLATWFAKHRDGLAVVTFSTLKAHDDAHAAAASHRSTKRRRA